MDLRKDNKVIRVNFSGGLIGLVFGSHKGKLQKEIDEQNFKGHVVYRAPDGTILRNTDDIVKYCTTDGQYSFFVLSFERKIKTVSKQNQILNQVPDPNPSKVGSYRQ